MRAEGGNPDCDEKTLAEIVLGGSKLRSQRGGTGGDEGKKALTSRRQGEQEEKASRAHASSRPGRVTRGRKRQGGFCSLRRQTKYSYGDGGCSSREKGKRRKRKEEGYRAETLCG